MSLVTEAAVTSRRYRDIAGLAVEVATVCVRDDLEADRDAVKTVLEGADLGKLGVAGLPAPKAPEMFDPA
jgi:hypothetical protein